MLRSIRARRRDRHLASDTRAGSWSAGEARRLQYRFLRRTWRRTAAVGAGALAVTPLALLLPEWSRGFVAGVWLTSVVWVIVSWSTLASGAGSRLMGEAGEQWTAQELRRMRSRGWRVANHVMIVGPSDVDHIAVGPGGLIVIETKWTSQALNLAIRADTHAGTVRALNERARRLRLMLKRHLGDTPVHTAVVLWGPEVVDDPAVQGPAPGNTAVLAGRSLRGWLGEIRDVGVQRSAIEAAWRVIDVETGRGDGREIAQARHPRAITDGLTELVAGVVAGFAGVIALGWLVQVIHSGIGQTLVTIGIIVVGFAARTVRSLRVPAAGWIAGAAGATLVALAYAAVVNFT